MARSPEESHSNSTHFLPNNIPFPDHNWVFGLSDSGRLAENYVKPRVLIWSYNSPSSNWVQRGIKFFPAYLTAVTLDSETEAQHSSSQGFLSRVVCSIWAAPQFPPLFCPSQQPRRYVTVCVSCTGISGTRPRSELQWVCSARSLSRKCFCVSWPSFPNLGFGTDRTL